jgi:hypothetical protein
MQRLLDFWRRHLLVIGYLLLCVAIAVIYIDLRHQTEQVHRVSVQVRRQAREGAQTHTAVCAYRADLNRRVHSSEQFLKDHPAGAFGVTTKVVRALIAQQTKTIDTLKVLRCG